MSPDDFVLALRALDAPVFPDDHGVASPLGVEFTATTSDGRNVLVTQLSAALNGRVTDPDAFVHTLKRAGYQGAGITESGQLYFLELPPRGGSLAERLARTGPVPAAELLAIARSAIDALAGAQPHGLITPSTVRVAGDGSVSFRWPALAPALRAAGVDAATIAEQLDASLYFAPEVQRDKSFDVHSDIFALGVTLYTALTGRPPFGGRTTATMMAVVLADDGAPATTVTGTLAAALLRAIEQEPADRWHDLGQFRNALGAPAAEARRAPDRPGAPRRRGCARTAAIVALGGLVLWGVSKYIS
ncbi:MAG TPA: protein kinase [Gemmatimonadaceae bacterium]|nr:protein kinase [Gemmatimonadaceae bacterium]